MNVFSEAGGLIYHARALRYRKTLWAPFRRELGAWLLEWKKPAPKLLIVGASGGYCLPREFLSQFDVIECLDPDPVAHLSFVARHGRVRWHSEDLLSDPTLRGFEAFLAERPDAAVLFSNVLGQIAPLLRAPTPEQGMEQLAQSLERVLRGRSFASFHDRYSRPAAVRASSQGKGGILEVTDHLTGALFAGLPRRSLQWELRPGFVHFIECCRST